MQMRHVQQTQKHTRHAKPDTIYPAAYVILAPVVAHPRTKTVAALRIAIYRLEQPVLIPPAVIHIHQIVITVTDIIMCSKKSAKWRILFMFYLF